MSDQVTTSSQSTQPPIERFEMRTNFQGLIQLLARNLYSEPDVFVRELIQNAHDSIRRRQHEDAGHLGRIDIEIRPQESTILFRDNGIGMDRDDIREFLSVIGSTGTGTARARLEESDPGAAFQLVGQFGIGMLSAFVVADHVTVCTRKLGSADAFRWENDGGAECRLRAYDRDEVGSEIAIAVGREHRYVLHAEVLRGAIIRYCDFLPIPIYVDGHGPVNTVQAPWDGPGWATDEAREATYRQFLSRRYPDVPLDVIPVEIEEPVRARGALYISDRRMPGLNTAGVVDLFVRRMFVRAADPDVLPEWAKFIRGVIECPDLQPTAARDNVQRNDWAYLALRDRIAGLIVDRLTYLAQHRPERFREINRWHHYHLKGMALFHDDFREKVAGLLLYETNRGLKPLASLFESDAFEPGPVYYFAHDEAASQFYGLARARGWLVVNTGHLFDEELLVRYARSIGAVDRLVRLDTDAGSALFGQPTFHVRAACDRFAVAMTAALEEVGLSHVSVHVDRFEPSSLPAVVLLSSESEAQLELETLVQQPWFSESLRGVTEEVMRQRSTRLLHLHLNQANPLVESLISRSASKIPRSALVGLFLGAALTARNLLTAGTVDALHGELMALVGCAAGLGSPEGEDGAVS